MSMLNTTNYWRIGKKLYDLTPWYDKHPGGRKILEIAKRYDDATYALESHHHNFTMIRKMLPKYELKEDKLLELGEIVPLPDNNGIENYPNLCDENSFYSILRNRVKIYLKKTGSGPKIKCILLFWFICLLWAFLFLFVLKTGNIYVAFLNGIVGAWVGAFGHNWVHQPNYRNWAYCLDFIGLSSEIWLREHVFEHHMFTNTPLDNHFSGTDPFLIVDPTSTRNWLQSMIFPLLSPIILALGIYGNYLRDFVLIFIKKNHEWTVFKFIIPLEIGVLMYRWGFLYGFLLMSANICTTSIYYFHIALINHNTKSSWELKKLEKCIDWGHSQLITSTDLGIQLSFWQSIGYLWLNYHTVHHMFPHIDMSHHPEIQKILMKTCQEYGIHYYYSNFWTMYREMIYTFVHPRALGQQIFYYYG